MTFSKKAFDAKSHKAIQIAISLVVGTFYAFFRVEMWIEFYMVW